MTLWNRRSARAARCLACWRAVGLAGPLACGGSGPRVGVLAPDGADSFPLMPFDEPFALANVRVERRARRAATQ